jgi:hypothetical protein
MAQTAKRNLTQPQPTPCTRLPRSSPRHESPASPPKTRPLHERKSASHQDIHEGQLQLASTAVTDQVHDPRYRHERRTISRGKAGGRKPMSRIMSDIGVQEREPDFREMTMDGSDELQQAAPLASHCWILPATRKSRPALPLLSKSNSHDPRRGRQSLRATRSRLDRTRRTLQRRCFGTPPATSTDTATAARPPRRYSTPAAST